MGDTKDIILRLEKSLEKERQEEVQILQGKEKAEQKAAELQRIHRLKHTTAEAVLFAVQKQRAKIKTGGTAIDGDYLEVNLFSAGNLPDMDTENARVGDVTDAYALCLLSEEGVVFTRGFEEGKFVVGADRWGETKTVTNSLHPVSKVFKTNPRATREKIPQT